LIEQIDENQSVPTNMLEPDQWDGVLSRITGTVYRGTERISSNALLNLLEVGPDLVTRQKVAKRRDSGSCPAGCMADAALPLKTQSGKLSGR
jgi:hypothetical protein